MVNIHFINLKVTKISRFSTFFQGYQYPPISYLHYLNFIIILKYRLLIFPWIEVLTMYSIIGRRSKPVRTIPDYLGSWKWNKPYQNMIIINHVQALVSWNKETLANICTSGFHYIFKKINSLKTASKLFIFFQIILRIFLEIRVWHMGGTGYVSINLWVTR